MLLLLLSLVWVQRNFHLIASVKVRRVFIFLCYLAARLNADWGRLFIQRVSTSARVNGCVNAGPIIQCVQLHRCNYRMMANNTEQYKEHKMLSS